MMTELKPCPFCNSIAYIQNESDATCFSENFYKVHIYCSSCPAEMVLTEHNLFVKSNDGQVIQKRYEDFAEKLIAAWNHRSTETNVSTRNKSNTMEVNMNRITTGDIVKHFKYETTTEQEKRVYKYKYYIVDDNAYDANTGDRLVIYRALYDNKLYVRPYDEFMSEVDHIKYPEIKQKYRFEK